MQSPKRLTVLYSIFLIIASIGGILNEQGFVRIMFVLAAITAIGLIRMKKWGLYGMLVLVSASGLFVVWYIWFGLPKQIPGLGSAIHSPQGFLETVLSGMAIVYIILYLVVVVVPAFALFKNKSYFN